MNHLPSSTVLTFFAIALTGCAAPPPPTAAPAPTTAAVPTTAQAGSAGCELRLSTTTSTQDSGLRDYVLPGF